MKSENRRTFFKKSILAGSGIVMHGISYGKQSKGRTAISMDTFEALYSRRSVREFKSVPVPSEHIEKLINAARMAPTAGNQQPWKFLVIQDSSRLDLLKKACIHNRMAYYKKQKLSKEDIQSKKTSTEDYYKAVFSARVYVVVLTDSQSKYPTYNHHDGPLGAGYFMLAARAMGYGTVYYTDSIPDHVTKEVLRIPDRYTRVCITPVGIPVEWPETPQKKDLNDLIAFETLS